METKAAAPHPVFLAIGLGLASLWACGGDPRPSAPLASATLEVFDPLLARSTLLASDLTTRYRHTAARLLSGEVLLAGGTEGGGGIKLVEVFR